MSENGELLNRDGSDPRLALWRWLPLALIPFIWPLVALMAYDDPFITYRYAANLHDGLGFVYNPGERILSTTTPLYTLILATLGMVWADLPTVSNVLGLLCLTASACLLWDFLPTSLPA